MKKYIIGLVTEDLNNYKRYLEQWHKMRQVFKEDEYHIRKKKALERKIVKIERYLERLEIEL